MSALATLCFAIAAATPYEGCKEACLAHVQSPRLRATVCGRCFTGPSRAAWAASLWEEAEATTAELEGLLDDDDWAVRWGGVQSLAKRKDSTETKVLAEWIPRALDRACVTAVHAAGARRVTSSTLLGPASRECNARRAAVVQLMEIEMYAERLSARREALEHLAQYLERPQARIVLDAMKSRPPQTDDLSAALLVEAAREGGLPAGKAVLDVPKSGTDEALVNRLLAQWAKLIDAQRGKLQSGEIAVRREAIVALAEVSPLSQPELESALQDQNGTNRRLAAAAIARGEGTTLAVYARRKLDPGASVPTEVRLMWVALTGISQDAACHDTLLATFGDDRVEGPVRSAALLALVDCDGARAFDTIAEAQTSSVPALRAGAALAYSQLPRQPGLQKRLEAMLDDPEAVVLAAAARSAGALRQTPLSPRLEGLLDHVAADVRRESALALAAMQAKAAVPRLARSLEQDPSPAVREACARSLGELGGPAAVPALIAASEKDKDDKVKFVAAESLRRLGFKRSP